MINHHTRYNIPYAFRTVCGFFNVTPVLWDGAYGLSSLSGKTWMSNHLQITLQRQHFLLIYLTTLSVGAVHVWTCDLPHGSPVLYQNMCVVYDHCFSYFSFLWFSTQLKRRCSPSRNTVPVPVPVPVFFSISKGDWKLLGDQLLAQFLQTCHFQVALTRTILFFPILVFSLTSTNKFVVKETVTVTRLWIANCVQQTGYKTRTEVWNED